jgi:hypothetical protein
MAEAEKKPEFMSALSDEFIDIISSDSGIEENFIRVISIAERIDGRFSVIAQKVEVGSDERDSVDTSH